MEFVFAVWNIWKAGHHFLNKNESFLTVEEINTLLMLQNFKKYEYRINEEKKRDKEMYM